MSSNNPLELIEQYLDRVRVYLPLDSEDTIVELQTHLIEEAERRIKSSEDVKLIRAKDEEDFYCRKSKTESKREELDADDEGSVVVSGDRIAPGCFLLEREGITYQVDYFTTRKGRVVYDLWRH